MKLNESKTTINDVELVCPIIEFDNHGKMIKFIEDKLFGIYFEFEYDDHNRLINIYWNYKERVNIFSIKYDKYGNCIKMEINDLNEYEEYHITLLEFHNNGNIYKIHTSGFGWFEFDTNGNLIWCSYNNGHFIYDENNILIKLENKEYNHIYEYDHRGRIIYCEGEFFTTNPRDSYTVKYDEDDNVIYLKHDEGNNIWIEWYYDSNGKILKEIFTEEYKNDFIHVFEDDEEIIEDFLEDIVQLEDNLLGIFSNT